MHHVTYHYKTYTCLNFCKSEVLLACEMDIVLVAKESVLGS